MIIKELFSGAKETNTRQRTSGGSTSAGTVMVSASTAAMPRRDYPRSVSTCSPLTISFPHPPILSCLPPQDEFYLPPQKPHALLAETMSDLEQSVVAANSSSPSLPATDSTALNYAFLVHSQKTLTQNLPPRVDNKLLARQKRRRTRYIDPR